MKSLVIAFSLIAFATSTLHAADDDIGRRLEPTLAAVLKAAKQNKHERLLVVVREMEGSQSRPVTAALLKQIESAMVDALTAKPLTAVGFPTAGKHLGEKSNRSPLTSEQIAAVQKVEPCDALVAADLRIMGRRTTLRMTLIDAERRLLFATVRLADTPVPQATLTQLPAANGAAGGAVPAGLIPPLAEGLSGFVKQANSNGANAAVAGGGAANGAGQAVAENTGEPVAAAGEINKAIVRFAVGQLGRQVGNGECWTLAAEALRAAGAEPPRVYDFGQEIELDDVTPGDILQFTSARFDNPNGSYYIMGAPNHTAIVYTVTGDQVFLLHQNFGTRTVTTLDINFNNMTSGEVQAYRAIPRE